MPQQRMDIRMDIRMIKNILRLKYQSRLSPQYDFSSTMHANNIGVEAQRAKLRLVIETV